MTNSVSWTQGTSQYSLKFHFTYSSTEATLSWYHQYQGSLFCICPCCTWQREGVSGVQFVIIQHFFECSDTSKKAVWDDQAGSASCLSFILMIISKDLKDFLHGCRVNWEAKLHLTRNLRALGRIWASVGHTILVWIYTCLLVQVLIYTSKTSKAETSSQVKLNTTA